VVAGDGGGQRQLAAAVVAGKDN